MITSGISYLKLTFASRTQAFLNGSADIIPDEDMLSEDFSFGSTEESTDSKGPKATTSYQLFMKHVSPF